MKMIDKKDEESETPQEVIEKDEESETLQEIIEESEKLLRRTRHRRKFNPAQF